MTVSVSDGGNFPFRVGGEVDTDRKRLAKHWDLFLCLQMNRAVL